MVVDMDSNPLADILARRQIKEEKGEKGMVNYKRGCSDLPSLINIFLVLARLGVKYY